MGLLGYIDSAVNPLRRLLGVETAPLPPGMSEVDYLALLDALTGGFGGADAYAKPVNRSGPKKAPKMQDRLTPARDEQDKAPVQTGSVRLARQQSGDLPPAPREFGLDTKMKLMMRRR